MSALKKILLWIFYGLSTLILASSLGQMFRQEMSINIFEGVQKEFHTWGMNAAVFIFLLYLAFYGSLYFFINRLFKRVEIMSGSKINSGESSLVILIWLLMILKPLKDVLDYLWFWDWWYLLLFLVINTFAIIIIKTAIKECSKKSESVI